MEFDEWAPLYEAIVEEFGFDPGADRYAADVLDGMLPRDVSSGWSRLRRRIEGNTVVIAGAALEVQPPEGGLLVAADGATTGLMEMGLRPDVIVTDLDGEVNDQIECSRKGSTTIVHAHGDNIPAIERFLPRFRGTVLGTTQVRPFGKVRNHGGFTDGDRAVMITDSLGAAEMILAGFRFDTPGRYSYHRNAEVKVAKLAWAERIIGMASAEVRFQE